MTVLQDVLCAKIKAERDRQDNLWGVQKFPIEKWLCVLMEEVGEVAKAANDNNPEEVKTELIQVAAVALKILEYIETGLVEGL